MDDFAGDTSTTGVLAAGGSITGAIETAGDTDWFRIQLTGGTQYRFYLQGVQVNDGTDPGGTLPQTQLRVMDSAGHVLATAGRDFGDNSVLDFVAPTDGTFYVEAASGVAGQTGTYTLSAKPFVAPAQIADYMVNGFWAPGVVQTNVYGARHFGHEAITVNVSALNANEQTLALTALDLYHQVSNLTFTAVTGAADITFTDDGTHVAEGGQDAGGVANGLILASHVHISSDWVTSGRLDSQAFQIYLHEIGHALGLGHAGPYNGGSIDYGIQNIFANDSLQFTVMSDFGWPGQALAGLVVTPQTADILAIQSMYGVNGATRADDTIYGFHSTAGPLFDFASYSGQVVFTIYDTGGHDTLDASGYAMSQTLDLRAGAFSSIGGATANIGISTSSAIEGGIGGSGADTITAGTDQSYLRGMDGNDSLQGGSGFDDINGNKGDDTIDGGPGGGDWLVGGQGNDSIVSHASNDILYGNLGNDTLSGGSGDEIIRGGQGDDSLSGGAGNDWISGDRGNDIMTGGSGADTFHTFNGAGIDRVLDFNAAEGDRVQLDPGTTYSVRQAGADTVIDLGNGDEMILVNVQMNTLPPGWIFGA